MIDDTKINFPSSNKIANNFDKYYILNGVRYRILVSGNQTQNSYSLIEAKFPSGEESEIPLHIRSRESVVVYVLEGEFVFVYNYETKKVNQGTILKFEIDLPLCYKKLYDNSEGKLLFLYIPAGFENFFKDLERLNVTNFKMFSDGDPILLQLLENNYGWRFIVDQK